MKYTPRKVFILENNGYTEITYEDLCHRIKSGESEYADKLFLPLHGMLMEVKEDAYKDFYRDKRRQKYLMEQSKENGDISYDALTTDEFNGEDVLTDNSEDVAFQVEKKIMTDKLRKALLTLSATDQKIIHEIYFNDLSERALAEKYDMSQVAIHKRKKRILDKLKKIL